LHKEKFVSLNRLEDRMPVSGCYSSVDINGVHTACTRKD
jgi:hypothetical protein